MRRAFLESIKKKAKDNPKTIVYPEGDEDRILMAAEKVAKEGFAKLIILGDEAKILERAKSLKLNLNGVRIINPEKYERFEEMANAFYELRKHKGITPEQAREIVKKPNYFGTMLVQMGEADGLVSGSTHSTADTVRPALEIIKTHEKSHKVSSFFFMVMDDKQMIFADCAVIIEPDAKDLAGIAIDTAKSAKAFDIEPRVAMLSFSTKGSATHPSLDKVKEAVAIVQSQMPSLVIDGEMQVDAALVPDVCMKKCPDCKIKGDANVLIFPDLNSGNISYKLVERLAKASAVGPILQGLRKPVNDLSRGCSVDDIVDVTAITVVEAQNS